MNWILLRQGFAVKTLFSCWFRLSMPIDYLNLSSSRDVNGFADKLFYRAFEIFPGFLSWFTLGLAGILSWLAPFWVAIFIIIFDLYWLLRVLYLAFHQVSSYRKMKVNSAVDWFEKLKSGKPDEWRRIYHLVILPFVNEEESVLRSTVKEIYDSNYPKDKFILVFALEERSGQVARDAVARIVKDYKDKFFAIAQTVHPGDIVGELAGKGSNVEWCVRELEKKFIPELGIDRENIIVSFFDIDTKPYPYYFACAAWHFLESNDRQHMSFQPIPVYNNNIWEAPAISRIVATSSTFWQMMQQERPELLVTFSSHSMPLKTLLEVGYPRNNVSDDSRIFWRAYFKFGGNYSVVPLYYPVSMDAVIAPTLWRTMLNQYKQQRRWSWGVENVPYVMFNLFRNPASKGISLQKKLFHVVMMLEGFWSWATGSILTFCLGWLPLLLGGSSFNGTLLSYNLPRLTSQIMTLAMAGMIVSAVISMLLLPPRPARLSKWRNLSMVLQWALLPVTLIVFGSIPALESQTRLMIQKPLGFWVTEKSRKV